MIIPAIIPTSIDDLRNGLATLSFSGNIQIDVVDGIFVENISWPYEPKGEPAEVAEIIKGFNIQVDLMTTNQLFAASQWLEAGARAVVFHIEGLKDVNLNNIIDLRSSFSFELGISLNNDTPIESISGAIAQVDFIQVMGISKIGSQGQPFDERVIERISALKALYETKKISVDGGVTKETIKKLQEAGADDFVVGSAILKASEPRQAYEELLKITSSLD